MDRPRRAGIRRRGLALAAAGAWCASCAVAAASPWSAPVDISPVGNPAATPELTVAPDGTATVAWTSAGTVISSRRAPSGAWSAAEVLSTASADPASVGFEPQLDGAQDGEAVGLWGKVDNPLQGALRPPGAPWDLPAEDLFDAGPNPVERRAFEPRLAVAPSGTGVAAWRREGAGNAIEVASLSAGGNWGNPVIVTAPGEAARDPAVAIAPTGLALAVWVSGANAVQAAARVGGDWAPPEVVGSAAGTRGTSAPDLALDRAGNAHAAWRDGTSSIVLANRPAAGPWTAPVRIAGSAARDARPRIAVGLDGLPAVTWAADDGRILVRTRDAAGVWGDIVALSAARSQAVSPRIAIGASGATIVSWIEGDPAGGSLRAAHRAPGEAWTAPLRVNRVAAATAHEVELDGAGNAVMTWLSVGAGQTTVTGARYAANRRCARVPLRDYPDTDPIAPSLTGRQLLINQRISQAAVRRAAAIEDWLAAGLLARDICGGGVTRADLEAAVITASATVGRALLTAAPRPITVPLPPRENLSGVTLSRRQLQINQRISQAAVRRINALNARLDLGLTGGDVNDGQLSPGMIDPALVVIGATPPPALFAPTRTVVSAPAAGRTRIVLSAAQILINQRISQAAVRRANDLTDRLLTGLADANLRDGTITALDLAPGGSP